MNPLSTFHQLSNRPSSWLSIAQIQAVWQPNDSLILLGEAAQGYQDSRLQSFNCIYVLEADANLLGLTNTDKLSTQYPIIQVIRFDDWAELILKYNKYISWQ